MVTNVSTYNITHVINNPDCQNGIGCLFKGINDVGQGWPILAILFLSYVLSVFVMIKKGNDTLKSFIASTFLMMFLTVICFVYELINERIVVTILIVLSVLVGVSIYIRKNQ